jgi:DNA-binding LacI/PurR family transcriptional regulator
MTDANGRRRRAPVMVDVAEAAGVSSMTVSRVLNGHPNVAESTRRRVESAMQRLGYRPNLAARTLASGRSATIGVVSVETPLYGPASTLFGIESAARAGGLFVSFVAVREVDEDHLRSAVEHLRHSNVDGIVVVAPIASALEAIDHIAIDVPVVVLRGADLTGSDVVAIDQSEGARLATRHLLELGHERVHHVRGPRGWFEAEARANAWSTTMREWGARVPRQLVGDWTPQSGYRAGRRLAADPDVSAVFVANDQMAIGVLLALHEAGRRVPDDVSVVGFDDIPESAFVNPPLTTVRQDFDELGRRCVHRLVALMAGKDSHVDGVVHTKLITRLSSGPPPG